MEVCTPGGVVFWAGRVGHFRPPAPHSTRHPPAGWVSEGQLDSDEVSAFVAQKWAKCVGFGLAKANFGLKKSIQFSIFIIDRFFPACWILGLAQFVP